MNNSEKTIIDRLEDFLIESYNNLNHDPNRVFEKDIRGNDVFIWENDLFLMEIKFIGIENIVELHVVYFKNNQELKPVWSLSLEGAVFIKESFSKIQDFRKSANHMHKYNGEMLPIKGPNALTVGTFKYTHIHAPAKGWKDFKNRSEIILINETKAFESHYDGGLMMSVDSLQKIWDDHLSKKQHASELK